MSPPDARWQDELDARVLQEEVQLALESLPPKHGEAFRLFHQNQLSYQEIARHMDVPSGTVKTWVHRARRELARRLVAREVVRPTGVEAS